MIKGLLLVCILSLQACAGTRDIRPYAFIQSEQFMQQGIKAYQHDQYLEAIRFFNKASVLYQSIDDQDHLLIARINMIKSALAISRFELATQTFTLIAASEISDPKLSAQITLLTAHHLFLQQHYQAALQTFAPLLQQLPTVAQPLNTEQLDLLLIQTKLALFAHSPDAINWFQRLAELIPEHSGATVAQNALFNRLAAQMALQTGNKEQASVLMQHALDLYKSKAKRRAIASCLEELAKIHIARQDKPAAKAAFNRALVIRQWLKDSYKTQLITQQLQTLNILVR